MKKVRYDDLIGLPFEEHAVGPLSYDCAGVVLAVYDRAGWSSSAVPTAANLAAACIAAESTAGGRSPWVALDAAVYGTVTQRLQFGDVVMTHSRGGVPHVSVVVDESKQLAASSAERLGVYACVVSRLSCVRAVYRMGSEFR